MVLTERVFGSAYAMSLPLALTIRMPGVVGDGIKGSG